MNDDSHIIVCAGPPKCLLEGDDAIEAANAGCPNCKHLLIRADGSETHFSKQSN
jgi:ssDNA-binding Zn-finger/Zn-ribbon topoisomerase 1